MVHGLKKYLVHIDRIIGYGAMPQRVVQLYIDFNLGLNVGDFNIINGGIKFYEGLLLINKLYREIA